MRERRGTSYRVPEYVPFPYDARPQPGARESPEERRAPPYTRSSSHYETERPSARYQPSEERSSPCDARPQPGARESSYRAEEREYKRALPRESRGSHYETDTGSSRYQPSRNARTVVPSTCPRSGIRGLPGTPILRVPEICHLDIAVPVQAPAPHTAQPPAPAPAVHTTKDTTHPPATLLPLQTPPAPLPVL
jgi:hypothetical protein